MTTHPQQIEDDEISLIDILLFLKASSRNVITSTIVCLLIGSAYYFAMPKMYEATATIQMAMVAGEVVETPAVLLEKIKLPLYFSKPTLQACGFNDDLRLYNEYVNKLKATPNKSAPLISLSTQAPSTQLARECLDAFITEIQNSQNELTEQVIVQKKQKLAQLRVKLKFTEDVAKSFSTNKANINAMDAQSPARTLVMSSNFANAIEMSELRTKIDILETDLIPPKTRPLSLVAPMYASTIPNNKSVMLTISLSLTLGLILGLLTTGLQRFVAEILRQMRYAENVQG